VQEQLDLEDGSAIRLTIARYYTPTGRCIQKPYGDDNDAYYEEEFDRLSTGELLNKDSIKFPDSLKFKTPAGKIVYGGGGIMPDYFIPIDTSTRSGYFNKIAYSGLFSSFAFEYADKNRKALNAYGSAKSFVANFNISNALFNEFIAYLEKNGIQKDLWGLGRSEKNIRLQLKAYIGRNIYNNDGFYPVLSLPQ
jgi:carboxyl-terminal processing protease